MVLRSHWDTALTMCMPSLWNQGDLQICSPPSSCGRGFPCLIPTQSFLANKAVNKKTQNYWTRMAQHFGAELCANEKSQEYRFIIFQSVSHSLPSTSALGAQGLLFLCALGPKSLELFLSAPIATEKHSLFCTRPPPILDNFSIFNSAKAQLNGTTKFSLRVMLN